MLAYAVDFDGDEYYELRFRDLATGPELDDVLPRSAPTGTWSGTPRRSSTSSTTTCGASTRSGGTGSGRRAADDVLVMEDPTASSRST